MAQPALQAATRTDTGKGAARTLRRDGKVPGVIYGHGREPQRSRSTRAALEKLLDGISAAPRSSSSSIDGRAPVKALIREIQRHPFRPAQILHVDFQELVAGELVTLEVPLLLVGTADGVRNFGGVLDQVLRELEIEVDPADIPDHIDVDVTALDHRALAPRQRPDAPEGARSWTTRTRRSRPSSRRGPRRRRPWSRKPAAAEPESSAKPKADAEGEAEGETKPKA